MKKTWVFFWGSMIGAGQALAFTYLSDSIILTALASITIYRTGLFCMRRFDPDFDHVNDDYFG